jgi:hypothetical protein
MTDDLIAFDRAEPHCVLAGSSRIGLLADAAAALPPGGLVAAGRREASGRDDDKILVRAPGEMPGSASLGAIIILQPFGTEAARLHRLTGATALAALRANSYGDWIAPRGPAEAAHLLALKAAVPVHALERPRDLSAIDACVALIAAL